MGIIAQALERFRQACNIQVICQAHDIVMAADAGYGYCPKCGAKGVTRERRLNGNDICENKHIYPSRDAVNERK